MSSSTTKVCEVGKRLNCADICFDKKNIRKVFPLRLVWVLLSMKSRAIFARDNAFSNLPANSDVGTMHTLQQHTGELLLD